MDFEICIDSIEGAKSALKFGAKRVELCASLDEGGTTPSIGMIKKCAEIENIETHVMIRPRAGNFVYSQDELLIMKENIIAAGEMNADGVVFGILDNNNGLDIQKNMFLMELALKYNLECTFHRAFDLCNDQSTTINDLINIGFKRILTSGRHAKAIDGITELSNFVHQANQKIEIMAGSGVNYSNALQLAQTGINALHFTARKKINDKSSLDMGMKYAVDEEKIINVLNQFK